MKKAIGLVALIAVVAAGLWASQNQAYLGQLALQHGGQLEARIHGLSERSVTAAGIEHRLYEGGDPSKPTLVMLHGYSADKDVWPRFAAPLLQDYHIIIPDMAGHGETGFKPEWSYDVPSQATRVVALMDAMGVKKFHVIGNSMGGFIAATLGASYPERILSVTAIDPAGVIAPVKSRMVKMIESGRNPFEVQGRAQFDEFYAMTMAKPPYLPDFVLAGMARSYEERRSELALIHAQFHHNHLLDQRLSEIKAPFFLIWGSKDELLDVSAAEVWKAGIPQIKVELISDLGHMPMVEDPEGTARRVAEFLKAI